MSKDIKVIRIFIASPGDVKPEREIAFSVANAVSHIFSILRNKYNTTVEAIGWEKVAPTQGIPNINIAKKYPVEDFDIVIGIFWKSFGNPPGTAREDGTEYSSGTEEEIERAFRAYQKNKRPVIMIYRKIDDPKLRHEDEIEQYKKVIAFFNECKPDGKYPAIYYEFFKSQFHNLLTDHLLQVISEIADLDTTTDKPDVAPEITEKNRQENNPASTIIYFSKLASAPTKPLNDARMIFIGQSSVGKTSLIMRLLQDKFEQQQIITEGINVDYGVIINDKGESIKLNIWDFGGQEIIHATHQFFLTKRSLYLLVLDARLTQEENRVEYWLKIIQSFGGESPVLIVGNKTDQHPLDIDRTGLQKKYPNIVGILETSAATGAGIDALKAEIAIQVDTLPHIRDLLPATWYTVKSKLEELGREKNFITQDEYLSLCSANDVTDETSQHTLISFLHDLGVVLHFQDDPRLEALGILNPQWVTNGIYKILNSQELFQNQGKLTLPILNKALNLPDYPSNKRLFIVDMMKKFELCYDIEPDKSFLIPDLLPKDEPFTGEWVGALAFQYHYNVLPSSIISRFIVRMNAFVHKTVWRSGVLLKSQRNTALIKADFEERKIQILISGDENTRRDFLYAIRMEFDAIHKTITKIEAMEKVPLPSHPEVAPVDYEFLLRLERDSRLTFPVQAGNDIVDVDVRELLDGIRPSKAQAPKVFLSYAHTDKMFAKKVASELEINGMKVWWDFDGLKGGQDWQKEIERGIKQCDFFLVALSPDAVNSEWVGNEILYASNAQKTIIPLHLKKCDIPIGLIKKQYIDFENQTQKSAIKELLEILKLNS